MKKIFRILSATLVTGILLTGFETKADSLNTFSQDDVDISNGGFELTVVEVNRKSAERGPASSVSSYEKPTVLPTVKTKGI